MKDISFTSKIKPVSNAVYLKIISGLGENSNVNKWTYDGAIKSRSAYTRNILDCTALGLTNGEDVFLMHICPDEHKNKVFKVIESFIEKNIDLDNPDLQGFLLGSKKYIESIKVFNNFSKFLEKHKIPSSIFRGGELTNHVAYSSLEDTWFINNYAIDKALRIGKDPKSALGFSFDHIDISKLDELV